MIAPELSQYSPVVRGIAYSQAQVSVKQNGVVIYQKNVPPDRLNYAILTKYSPVTWRWKSVRQMALFAIYSGDGRFTDSATSGALTL